MLRFNLRKNQLSNAEQMKQPLHTNNQCVYCGCNLAYDMGGQPATEQLAANHTNACQPCLGSLKDRTPPEWLRWLKRNNPLHWQKVVDHNRLLDTELANMIRRIRIE